MKDYINFSSGVDSTYYLWKLLKENPGKRIFVHHCLLFKRRREVEKIATDNILQYFRDNGMGNFHYTETVFSKKGISGKLYDIEPIYFLTGLILKNEKYKDIQNIYIPICREEMKGTWKIHLQRGKPWKEYDDKENRFYKSMLYCNNAAGRSFDYHSPWFNKTKKEMIDEMPKELFDMIWYCRRPAQNKPCKACFNCKRVHKAIGK